jgi:glycine/D-amino acid oxidase-like deaminating enzyme
MLNDPKSHGLWEITAPPAPVAPGLNGTVAADVAIVGGGYTGLSAALHLATAGVKAVLLEGKEIGFGGAGRNVGLINAGLWVLPDDVVSTLGPEFGERLLHLLGHGPGEVMDLIEKHDIDCELRRQGTLHCAAGPEGLQEIRLRAEQWQKRGARVEVLGADEAAQRIGGHRYTGALLDHRAGTLQPLAYARGLAAAAIRTGAKIFTGSAVRSLRREDARWIVESAEGSVSAEWVIVATDAYSSGCFSGVREEQVRLPYFNFATAPLSDNLRQTILPNGEGAWDTKTILSSFRLDSGGRLIFGSVGALRNTGALVHRAWARRELARLFPQLGSIEFEHEWFGQIGMTADAMPRFHIFAPNVIGFSGYNGRGIAPGTVFGRLLSEFVRGAIRQEDLPLPVTPMSKVEWRTAKEAYYELGAQIAHAPGAIVP